MKKICIIAALMALINTSHAIAISWGINGAAMFNSTVLAGATVTLYYGNGDFAKTETTNNAPPPFDSANGQLTGKGHGWTVSQTVLEDTENVYSMDFYAVITYSVGGVDYVNYSNIGTVSGWELEMSEKPLTLTFDWGTITENEWMDVPGYVNQEGYYQDQPVKGGGWYATPYAPPIPVPEPATAGLALAGLALLFRRKRK